jgi:integrase
VSRRGPLRFCVLTATRTSETRLARWREVDTIAREWTIPQDRMKAGKEHTVLLSEAAFENRKSWVRRLFRWLCAASSSPPSKR